jgi:hypothetical protein
VFRRLRNQDHFDENGEVTEGINLKPAKREVEIRRMKSKVFRQRMASAGERPGNLNRFGADSFLCKPAESIQSSSGTVTTGNSFKAPDSPSGDEGISKRTTNDAKPQETEGWNPLET